MGPRLLEITQTCPRCQGIGQEPRSNYAICIRCEGKKTVTTTQIEFPPSFITSINAENINLELLEKGDPRTQLNEFVSVMNPDHN